MRNTIGTIRLLSVKLRESRNDVFRRNYNLGINELERVEGVRTAPESSKVELEAKV